MLMMTRKKIGRHRRQYYTLVGSQTCQAEHDTVYFALLVVGKETMKLTADQTQSNVDLWTPKGPQENSHEDYKIKKFNHHETYSRNIYCELL